MIRLTGTARAFQRMTALRAALTPQAIDPVVDRAAQETFAELVKATPKRWFGQLRRSWVTIKPEDGVRILRNESKVMVWIEEGTANAGTGMIRPRVKKALYIPLTRRAAAGWHQGLVYGKDYILKKEVRGIKPRHIVAKERPKAQARLRAGMVQHIRKAVNG